MTLALWSTLSIASGNGAGAQANVPCAARSAAGDAAARGWIAYRRNDLPGAAAEFQRALALCPRDGGALTGVGYIALRQGHLGQARAAFSQALGQDSSSYDAATGSGMTAYRSGRLADAYSSFQQALRLVPGDSVARAYLLKLPVPVDTVSLAPYQRPAITTVIARTGKRVFEVPDSAGQWIPLWIKAVNLGAALPGKHPSEFPPNDSTYERWIATVAGMGANAIRVYTIHPPHFYQALRRWNLAHRSHPIWLIHGVWTELPPGRREERYDDPRWKAAFRSEIERVVSLLHGNAAIAPQPGHASGVYSADVSAWTLGYIIGREWEPYSVVAYNASRPAQQRFDGRYVTVTHGNALEVWLAAQCEHLIDYEMSRYNAQRPIAYTNWPTLDPLRHPTETTKVEEVALLRARGERIVEPPKEYDNDAVSLDASHMRATTAFSAGVFASFHAYPYYPDFLLVDPGYSAARSASGPGNYLGYLRDLVRYHGDIPVLISEYGVPSSRGVAHVQPQGFNHGGLSERAQADVDAQLTRDIYASGAAGAGLFAMIDEWFKKNWLVTAFELPAERKRLWFNPLDAEESYGVIAMRPGAKDSAIVIDGDTTDWRGRAVWYSSAPRSRGAADPLELRSLRLAHDAGYVYLRLDVGRVDWTKAHYQIGIDTYRRALGDTRLPVTGTRSPTGLEFVLSLRGPGASELLVDHPYNPYRPVPIPGSSPSAVQYVFNRPFRTVANDLGRYDSLVVVTNRRRITRAGQIIPSVSSNRNRLLYERQSANSLADWYADTSAGVIEVRLAWSMLQMVDPSSRSALFGNARTGEPAGQVTDGFRFVVESYDPAHPRAGGDYLPRDAAGTGFAEPPTWTWAPWESPQWHAELKPLFSAMQAAFNEIPDHPSR